MYANMHACMYVLCMYRYICMYACMYVCMHVCMHACIYVCMHACIYVCMHECIYVSVCMYCMHACLSPIHAEIAHAEQIIVYLHQKKKEQYTLL